MRTGDGLAKNRIGATSRLRVADAILSGTHEPGTSHYDLLRTFANDDTLRQADEELETHGYRSHEFGDSILIWRWRGAATLLMSRAKCSALKSRRSEALGPVTSVLRPVHSKSLTT